MKKLLKNTKDYQVLPGFGRCIIRTVLRIDGSGKKNKGGRGIQNGNFKTQQRYGD